MAGIIDAPEFTHALIPLRLHNGSSAEAREAIAALAGRAVRVTLVVSGDDGHGVGDDTVVADLDLLCRRLATTSAAGGTGPEIHVYVARGDLLPTLDDLIDTQDADAVVATADCMPLRRTGVTVVIPQTA